MSTPAVRLFAGGTWSGGVRVERERITVPHPAKLGKVLNSVVIGALAVFGYVETFAFGVLGRAQAQQLVDREEQHR